MYSLWFDPFGVEPKFCLTRGEHANHCTTKTVYKKRLSASSFLWYNWMICLFMFVSIFECIFLFKIENRNPAIFIVPGPVFPETLPYLLYQDLHSHRYLSLCVLRWDLIVRVVDIGGIVDRHCLIFLYRTHHLTLYISLSFSFHCHGP